MKIKRVFSFVFAVILAAALVFLFLVPHTPGEAAAGAQSGYEARMYTLAAEPLPGSGQQKALIGYRAYVPRKKMSDHIVVLVSGWTCGPAWLHYAAACLAERHGLEVWTVKRRMAFFEDREAWNADLAPLRSARLQKIENYFTGGDPRVLDTIGYGVLLDDMDIIVRAAGKQKQPVILGGWSDGSKFVMAYAHRKFADGKRGHERLAGLLFIDENPEWGTRSPEVMKQELAKKSALAETSIYERRWPEVTVFEAVGVLAERSMHSVYRVPAAGAQEDQPQQRRLGAQENQQPQRRLGAQGWQPPASQEKSVSRAFSESPLASLFPHPRLEMTDTALLGWLYDGAGGTSAWGWLVSAGGFDVIAQENQPQGHSRTVSWKNDGGNTPIERLAMIHALPEVIGSGWQISTPNYISDGVWEWFYPHRIGVDFWEIGLSGFQHERLRIAPDKNNRLPVFAALTGFNKGVGVPPGIRWWIERTGIQDNQITLYRYDHFRHADILLAPAAEEEVWAKFAAWVSGIKDVNAARSSK